MSQVTFIAGSPTVDSRSTFVLNYLQKKLDKIGIYSSFLDIRNFSPSDLVYARFDSPSIVESIQEIQESDGIIIGTPVYKGTYSGVLKSYLDLLPQDIFVDKVIFPLATGGSLAHLLSIDFSFKPLLANLGAQQIIKGVYLVDSKLPRNENKQLHIEQELENRLIKELNRFVNAITFSEKQKEITNLIEVETNPF
jgi:FMN reductase